jgi:hypoxanthine-guanine phosphoribosyltransferase
MSKEKLEVEVSRVANEIHRDLQGTKPIFIGVLNGAFIFMADLVRRVNRDMEVELDFIKLSSYEGTIIL